MFLEDQLIDDGHKVEKASSSAEIPIRLIQLFHLYCMLIVGESYRKVMVTLKMKKTL